jgi:hypothetical protein
VPAPTESSQPKHMMPRYITMGQPFKHEVPMLTRTMK